MFTSIVRTKILVSEDVDIIKTKSKIYEINNIHQFFERVYISGIRDVFAYIFKYIYLNIYIHDKVRNGQVFGNHACNLIDRDIVVNETKIM